MGRGYISHMLIIFSGATCVTLSTEFKTVCLSEPALRTVLECIHDLRGDYHEKTNKNYRFAAYKQFIWWVYGKLGRGVRKRIPSCVMWAIREIYPSGDGKYVPYAERS